MKQVIIVEGPAGAGKTTWITERLAEDKEQGVLSQKVKMSSGDRFPDEFPAMQSMWLDLQRVMEAVRLLQQEEMERVYIDRCFFSELIYGTLRKGGQYADMQIMEMAPHLWSNWQETVCMCYLEYQWRFSTAPAHLIDLDLEVIVALILPSYMTIMEQRASSDREYPTGHEDVYLYNLMWNFLKGAQNAWLIS